MHFINSKQIFSLVQNTMRGLLVMRNTIRSVYHVREYDVHQLLQFEEPIDIFLSHDWPVCITDYGNSEEIVR